MRIAIVKNSAYYLYLQRNLRNAELVGANSPEECFRFFVDEGLDAMAGLKPLLIIDQGKLPESTILPGGLHSHSTGRGDSP
ncbi:hypothetical protein ACFS07_34310 [Undibacterium arcticum]